MKPSNEHVITKVAAALDMSILKLERELGLKSTRLHAVKKSDRALPDDILYKILEKFPQFDRKWLETGEGGMYVTKLIVQKDGEMKEEMPAHGLPLQSIVDNSDYVNLLEKTLEEYREREKSLFAMIDTLQGVIKNTK